MSALDACPAPSGSPSPLRRARFERNLTLRQLGALAAIEYSKLSRAERGLCLRPEEYLRLSGVLGVPADVLRGGGRE